MMVCCLPDSAIGTGVLLHAFGCALIVEESRCELSGVA